MRAKLVNKKKCYMCLQILPFESFYIDRKNCGLQSICKECNKIRMKEYYAKNKEKLKLKRMKGSMA